MSSGERRLARAVVPLAALALLGATSGCGSDAAGASSRSAPAGATADATTRSLAEVEWARQCTVDRVSHPDESAFTTDLDARLSAAGFTHEQWKRWHDALADSPELITQFAEISATGCPPT